MQGQDGRSDGGRARAKDAYEEAQKVAEKDLAADSETVMVYNHFRDLGYPPKFYKGQDVGFDSGSSS